MRIRHITHTHLDGSVTEYDEEMSEEEYQILFGKPETIEPTPKNILSSVIDLL